MSVADRFLEPSRQPSAADQAGAADPHVEIADDAPQRERARPGLEVIELVVGVAAADQGAHRGADNDVGRDAVRLQRVNHADMGEAARRAAAENEPDRGPAALGRNGSGSNVDDSHLFLAYVSRRGRRLRLPSVIHDRPPGERQQAASHNMVKAPSRQPRTG